MAPILDGGQLGSRMKRDSVVNFLNLCERAGIKVWIDGGWGVDALLGEQTREHEDLDIAVQRQDLSKLRELLKSEGYQQQPRNDDQEYMFVMVDSAGHKIDVHAFEFDAEGNNTYGIQYPYDSLQGQGTIGGKQVKCIAAEWVVKFHTAYQPDKNDYHDVKLLCERFGIALPDVYATFENA